MKPINLNRGFLSNKKGSLIYVLVDIVIVIIAFALITVTVRHFITNAEPKAAEEFCRDSLVLKAQTKVEVGSVGSVSTLSACKTQDSKFSATKVEEAQQFIAQKVERCWWQWLEGSKSQMFGPRGLVGNDEKTQCFVCYNLIYDSGPTLYPEDVKQGLLNTGSKYRNGSVIDYVQEHGNFHLEDSLDSLPAPGVYSVVFASNIENSIWKQSFTRGIGLYKEYTENSIWLVRLSTLQKDRPCIVQQDIAGK